LNFLRRYYTPPRASGESNHFFDLWNGTSTPIVARLHGLTNNRALFIDSHGRSDALLPLSCYVYYPHRDLLPQGEKPPCFSAGDLAHVVGDAAREIHNVLVSGCNAEGGFDPRELRKYFLNATNIVHAVAGEDGFKPMFYAAIVNSSSANKPLYATRGAKRNGQVAYHLSERPSPEAKLVQPYLASLFRPGEIDPYQIRVAGRELLQTATTRFHGRPRPNEDRRGSRTRRASRPLRSQ
jgi:hypothetical protein